MRSIIGIVLFSLCMSCQNPSSTDKAAPANGQVPTAAASGTPADSTRPVRLITLDPGHFHAALVQKSMYADIDPVVHVYAPDGPDLKAHLERIGLYNSRPQSPTHWNEKVYTGVDFLQKMISEKAGNTVVLSGNNLEKINYIASSLAAGFNVLADKPMVIGSKDFPLLEKAFSTAAEKNLRLYDIMTERFEITNYSGIGLKATPKGWQLSIPEQYKEGHEAHFARLGSSQHDRQILHDHKSPRNGQTSQIIFTTMTILSIYRDILNFFRQITARSFSCISLSSHPAGSFMTARNARPFIFLVLVLSAGPAMMAQTDTLRAHVYNWDNLRLEKDSSLGRRQVLDGNTPDLAVLEIHASSLEPGKSPHPPHTHADMEELVIVKEGELRATVKDKTKILGPGSIAYALPGDLHGFENAGHGQAIYYVLKFRSRAPVDSARGVRAGGSFLVDWNALTAKKNEKGERRDVFDTPTSLFRKIDMHVTTLNPGEVSHAPHVHRQEEIILLRKGDVQMQIGDRFYKASAGDLIFLSSGVLHALKNTGSGPCEYFALQWQ